MGEFPAASLPAILVPYPHSGRHQMANAEQMVRNGAARLLLDEELDADLVRTILDLLSQKDELEKMKESASAMLRQDAASAIAEQLWLLARQRAGLASEAKL
jgi:UDP-N-acetylglucosamine--N-acetylmuramyl-(pentapeptide) pyrophosphoryl-undecaprenol N-acetylglucosamine transferase